MSKEIEIMCQNSFTGRTVQNVVESIILILFVFFPTIISKYVYQLSEKTLILLVFDFLGLKDPHLKKIIYFLCLLEPWGLLFIKFGKSYNKRLPNNRARSAKFIRGHRLS